MESITLVDPLVSGWHSQWSLPRAQPASLRWRCKCGRGTQIPRFRAFPSPRQSGGSKGCLRRLHFMRTFAPCFASAGDGQPVYLIDHMALNAFPVPAPNSKLKSMNLGGICRCLDLAGRCHSQSVTPPRCLKTEGLADKGFAPASTSGAEMPGSPPGPARTLLDGRSIDLGHRGRRCQEHLHCEQP
jgi:hypothetical protein